MSDRMTSARLRDGMMDGGYAAYGRLSRSQAIAEYRAFAKYQFDKWKRVVEAKDEDIVVETYVGVYAMRNMTEVMK